MKVAAKFSLIATIALVLTAGAAGAAGPDPKAHLANKDVDFSQARSLPYDTTDQVMFENVIINNQRFALLARWRRAILEIKELRLLNTVTIPYANINIDGNFGDWEEILPAVEDPTEDWEDPQYVNVEGTDLKEVYLARDNDNLYGLMTMYNEGPLQGCLYVVELQQYLYQLHTPGDLIISMMGDAGGNWGLWVQDRGPGHEIAYYSDYVSVSVGMIEWKVPLVDLWNPDDTPDPYSPAGWVDQGIENRFIRAYIHPGPHPGSSPVADINDRMTRPMIINFYQ